jgi:hypothetical protein
LENKTFRPDTLQVVIKSDRTLAPRVRKVNGTVRLVVTKAFNEPVNEIAIENTYRVPVNGEKMRETALVNITFADGSQFTGNFDELKRAVDANRLLWNMCNARLHNDPHSEDKYMQEAIALMATPITKF